jgi:hypothetical protein
MATTFVNQVNFIIPTLTGHEVDVQPYPDLDRTALFIPNLIPAYERDNILTSLAESNWQPVSITGMSGNWKEGDPIGSYRASNYTQEYADILWDRIKHAFPTVRVFTDADNTDWDDHEEWEPFGVSPLLRFIKYENGGWLVVHYDAPYIQSEDVRTLQSFVIYLQHDETITGGATRYLNDPQATIPVRDRKLSDEQRAAEEEEVRLRFSPDAGTGVIFDHRLLHDAELVEGDGSKVIIRTDIMYRRVK